MRAKLCMQTLLRYKQPLPPTVKVLIELLTLDFSEPWSNRRWREEETYRNFIAYTKEVAGQ